MRIPETCAVRGAIGLLMLGACAAALAQPSPPPPHVTGTAPIVVTPAGPSYSPAVSCPTCGTGTGNVTGPAGATSGNLAVYDGATGLIIKDGGVNQWTAGAVSSTSGPSAVSAGALVGTTTTAGKLWGFRGGGGSGLTGTGAAVQIGLDSLISAYCADTTGGVMFTSPTGGAGDCLGHGTVGQYIQQQQPGGNFFPTWATITSYDHVTMATNNGAAIVGGFFGFTKYTRAQVLTNFIVTSDIFVCTVNPVVTLTECGTSASCGSTPTTMGSATITTGVTAMPATLVSTAIAAGHYIAASVASGTCTALSVNVTAETSETD